MVFEDQTMDGVDAPAAVSPPATSSAPVLLQPTIVALPPAPNNHQQGNANNSTIESPPVCSDTNTKTHAGNTSTLSDIIDTSKDAEIAAALAAEEAEQYRRLTSATNSLDNTTGIVVDTTQHQSQPYQSSNDNATNPNYTVATASAPWQYDDLHNTCYKCHNEFNPIVNRKHHCRYCGYIFCNNCSKYKSLIPPSRIVLHPISGKKAKPPNYDSDYTGNISFTPNPDPDRMLTYIVPNNGGSVGSTSGNEQLLYGRGLEERFLLAREPLRVCYNCHTQLQPLQEELRYNNSHAMRYNTIDPTHVQRLFNSPFANTLGHEIRKAAYALNNLLPQPKRKMNAFIDIDSTSPYSITNNPIYADIQQCKDTCSTISPNLNELDGVQIPAKLLEQAKGVAILTVIKGGFGFVGGEFGTGLVVARLPNIVPPSPTTATDPLQQQAPKLQSNHDTYSNSFRWSAPSAIGTAGLSWGALIGAQVSDHVFLLMSDEAVRLLYNNKASIQLGADVGIALGPIGRTIEGDLGLDGKQHKVAPIYTYSMSKGLYAGISLDGKVIVTRPDVNEKFYGMSISAEEILAGVVPTPPAAQPLYDALQRCHVYASMAESNKQVASLVHQQRTIPPNFSQLHYQYNPMTIDESSYMQEYGETLQSGEIIFSPPQYLNQPQQQQHPLVLPSPTPLQDTIDALISDADSNSIIDDTSTVNIDKKTS